MFGPVFRDEGRKVSTGLYVRINIGDLINMQILCQKMHNYLPGAITYIIKNNQFLMRRYEYFIFVGTYHIVGTISLFLTKM